MSAPRSPAAHAPGPASADAATDREIVLTRLIDAPRELVWKAWTDPEEVRQWWGPHGFTTTTRRMDVRPGGQWRFVMHGPDGHDYENLITYVEVKQPERLIYRHGGEAGVEPVNFEVTVTFDKAGASGDKTALTLRMVFPSALVRESVIRKYGALEGGRQTLARLAEYVTGASARSDADPGKPFIISRVVRAPRDLVWKVWTQRDHIMKWFGPKGVTIPKCTLDFRPGGVFHYLMQGPEGSGHWGRWVFREITPPERLVFVGTFSDEQGNVTRAPFDETWPMEMLSVVTFEVHAGIGGGTLVTVRWTALNASAAEQETFDLGHESIGQGWSGTFDALAEYLEQARV